MVRALERGLCLSDFNDMTVGMILDFIITFNNDRLSDDERDDARTATQADFDRF